MITRLRLAGVASVIGLAVAALQVWPSRGDAAGTRMVVLTVQADTTNSYGMPWDGLGHTRFGLFGLFTELPVSSPPDLVACVVAGDAPVCDLGMEGGQPASRCHDHYRCAFRLPVPRDRAFGILVYDLDSWAPGGLNDLVDAFVVADPGQEAGPAAEALRRAVAAITPTEMRLPAWLGLDRPVEVFPAEKQRRAMPLRILAARECEARPCRLSQSQIGIKRLP